MAHFYGGVQGARGPATRLGHKNTGLLTHAEGWGGKVIVGLDYDAAQDRDMARVTLESKQGRTLAVLYRGPLNEYLPLGEQFTTWMAAKALTEDTPKIQLGRHLAMLAELRKAVEDLGNVLAKPAADPETARTMMKYVQALANDTVKPFETMLPKVEAEAKAA